MILGAHESAQGGVAEVWERARRDRADCVQLWTRSSRQWASRPLDAATVAAFRAGQAASPMPTAAHASYLINLGAANDAIYARSIETLVEECERAAALGIDAVVLHPGAATGTDEKTALARTAAALRTVLARLGPSRVRILVENTAGMGSSLGCTFGQIGAILDGVKSRRLGVCIDTQHLFAAGYDWTTPRGYASVMRELDEVVGLERVAAFHLNDSKKPLGSRVDRHAVIGDGLIGLQPFGRLINDERFAAVPGYLETPPLPSGEESYAEGLRRLRTLLRKRKPA